MNRQEAWVEFATHSYSMGIVTDTALAAKYADQMLAEFDKRFPEKCPQVGDTSTNPQTGGREVFLGPFKAKPDQEVGAGESKQPLTATEAGIRRQAFLDAAAEVRKHWIKASGVVNQKDQAEASARCLERMAGEVVR